VISWLQNLLLLLSHFLVQSSNSAGNWNLLIVLTHMEAYIAGTGLFWFRLIWCNPENKNGKKFKLSVQLYKITSRKGQRKLI